MRIKHQQEGFTLLEVIMALVVLSAAIIPLFMLFSTHLDTMRRMADANEKAAATSMMLSLMETVNPAETPTGDGEAGGYVYNWSSEPALEMQKIPKSNFQIGLFDTTVIVNKNKDKPWFDLKVRLTGYEAQKEGNRSPPPLPGGSQNGEGQGE